MRKETLYLDTSVLSAYYDKRTKERQETTIKFWKEILPHYQVYISDVTIDELESTRDERLKRQFRKLLKNFKVLITNERIQELAKGYVEKDVFPERYINDALHVAVASFYEIRYLVSWNFEHLVKVKTRKRVNAINIAEGFKEIEIISPQEL